jgi:hypothetical protein
MEHILTAKDVLARDGAPSLRAWITRIAKLRELPKPVFVRDGEDIEGEPVKARVDAGRWIADCECGGAEYADPDEPIFWCFSCGNVGAGGLMRAVVFPKDRKRIEQLLLARPVVLRGGKGALEQAMRAVPVKLPRAWEPGVTAKQLTADNKSAGLPADK